MARQTQAERSASTRALLLEATIDSLVEVGWTATTTSEVVRRAGVSRGAQVHHFPTKDDLVLAAMEHVIERRVDEYRIAFEQLPADRRTPTGAVELLWDQCFGRTFDVWLELTVAAKHSAALHDRFVELDRLFTDNVTDLFQRYFPTEFGDREVAVIAMRLTFGVLAGIALGRISGVPDDHLRAARDAFDLLTEAFLSRAAEGATD
jgi:AcrR family transcriptional regulator